MNSSRKSGGNKRRRGRNSLCRPEPTLRNLTIRIASDHRPAPSSTAQSAFERRLVRTGPPARSLVRGARHHAVRPRSDLARLWAGRPWCCSVLGIQPCVPLTDGRRRLAPTVHHLSSRGAIAPREDLTVQPCHRHGSARSGRLRLPPQPVSALRGYHSYCHAPCTTARLSSHVV